MSAGYWREEQQIVKRRRLPETSEESSSLRSDSPTTNEHNIASNLTQLTELMTVLANNVNKTNTNNDRVKSGGDMIPTFDPEEKSSDINKWLYKVEEIKSIYGWDELTTIHNTTVKLRGLAEKWYASLPTVRYTWSEWKAKLTQAFPTQIDYAQLLEEMLKRTQKRNESFIKYYYDKIALLNLCEIQGPKAVSCLIAGMSDHNIQAAAKVGDYKEPEQLLRFLKTMTSIINTENQHPKAPRPIPVNRNFEKRNVISKKKCYGCGSRDHLMPSCPKRKRRCEKCDKFHSGECLRNVKQVLTLEKDRKEGEKYFMNLVIDNIKSQAFVDLGASVNTMIETFSKQVSKKVENTKELILGFGGGKLLSKGKLKNVKVEIDQATAITDFVIVPDEAQKIPIIIGQPLTEQEHIVIYKDKNNLRIYEQFNKELPGTIDLPEAKVPIWAKEALVIPPKHAQNVLCRCEDKGEFLIETSLRMEEMNEHCILRCMVEANEEGECVLPIINTSSKELKINPKKILARGKVVRKRDSTCPEKEKSTTRGTPKLDVGQLQMDESLTDQQRTSIVKMLRKYNHCFSTCLKDLGCTTADELKIDLIDETPVAYRPYRMSTKDQQKVKEIVKELLDNGIIRESTSPFSSPVLLVKKKNGQERLCIDYRRLNTKIKQNRFPLPRIDEQISQLQGHKYFTTLDMMSGYYQIPVEENSRAKTAFVTPDGQYEFTRMPFGISTAPGIFQRMINNILGPLRGTIATAYLDDILIPSKTFEQGMKRLQDILNILQSNNLTLNIEKCHFFKTKIDYLGFEITEEGIQPGANKTKSIQEFPTPTNVHKVRQFLGLTGFFRQFIEGYAVIAKPLTELTKKSQKWKWENPEDEAFQKLKEKLIKRPLLAIYNPNAVTEVHTDACQKGLAGILLQKQENGKLQPVAYYSRQTTPAEEKYHSYELETLAVVETLKKFRSYLIDKEFKTVTDCNAIKATAKKRDIIPRIARWWLLLQEFTFTVEYRAGNKMGHVDALSRNAAKDDSPLDENHVFRIEVADWVLAGQLSDEKIKLIHEILQRKPTTEYEKNVHTDYKLVDSRVYRKTKDGDKWVVPKGMRNQILRNLHDDFGHYGLEKTLLKISEQYWFPNMKEYVARYLKSCIPCLYHKKPKGKQPGMLHPIEKNPTPFHTLHMDHLGPFIKSSTGKKFLIVAVEAFTKYTLLKAVKDTKTQPVIGFLRTIMELFGTPMRLITDKGTCYTSKLFQKFCIDKGIKHVQTAVATPRANGQVERFNSTILTALATTAKDDTHWDREVSKVQFAINNTVHSVTRKTPSELLFGYKPRPESDAILTAALGSCNSNERKLEEIRNEAITKITTDQHKQKLRYDRKRKAAKEFKVGDLVLVKKPSFNEGQSKKLLPVFKGPFQIKKVLGNDRYVVSELPDSRRTSKTRFENVESIDHLKEWDSGSKSDSDKEEDEGDKNRSNDTSQNEDVLLHQNGRVVTAIKRRLE